ncbi:hypothetical protein [Ornithinimicrobium kibberense]|uniref:hypothetical protein n=1 Tax=Ornithinimicrobium kibberense TaxID=282060 RepID=UPI003615376A
MADHASGQRQHGPSERAGRHHGGEPHQTGLDLTQPWPFQCWPDPRVVPGAEVGERGVHVEHRRVVHELLGERPVGEPDVVPVVRRTENHHVGPGSGRERG